MLKDYLEKRMGLTFKSDQNLRIATTHSSYVNEKQVGQDYERLEFIGDAVLQICVSQYIFKKFPNYLEGQMTTLRAQIVREESLAKCAREMELGRFIRMGKGEMQAKGYERDSVLANVFEAVLGVVYLDCGLEACDKFLSYMYECIDRNEFESVVDYKTTLQEYVQADIRKTVTYNVESITGPSNQPTFEMQVLLDGIVLGRGKGSSKKRAEQLAAKQALEKLAVNKGLK